MKNVIFYLAFLFVNDHFQENNPAMIHAFKASTVEEFEMTHDGFMNEFLSIEVKQKCRWDFYFPKGISIKHT